MQTTLIAANNKVLLSTNISERKMMHSILKLLISQQFLERDVCFLNSSNHFVPVETAILHSTEKIQIYCVEVEWETAESCSCV